jgi:MYXO-CTERM domain-containing protein
VKRLISALAALALLLCGAGQATAGFASLTQATDSYDAGQSVTIGKSYGSGHITYTGQDISFHIQFGSGATGPSSPKMTFALNALGGGTKNILLFGIEMDSSIQSDLTSNGYSSTIASDFSTASFSGFSGIWVSWESSLPDRIADLTAFVNAGGNLLIETPGNGNLPFSDEFTRNTFNGGNNVHIVTPGDTVNAGLTDSGLSGWNSSYHETYTLAPEPASLTLAGFGVLALAGYGWRRRQRQTQQTAA